jgi:hypothetical protein
MGRWSQRNRSGGGQSINFMVSASFDDSDTVIVDFLNGTNIDQLTNAAFISKPNNDAATAVTVLGPTQLQVDFGVDVSLETGIEQNSAVPGILSPQTQTIT